MFSPMFVEPVPVVCPMASYDCCQQEKKLCWQRADVWGRATWQRSNINVVCLTSCSHPARKNLERFKHSWWLLVTREFVNCSSSKSKWLLPWFDNSEVLRPTKGSIHSRASMQQIVFRPELVSILCFNSCDDWGILVVPVLPLKSSIFCGHVTVI